MDEDFNERFLKANANPDHIAHCFAEVVRNLMRAVAASDSSRPLFSAAEAMKFVAELLQRSENSISWYSLFAKSVENIHGMLPEDVDDKQYIRAAQDGIKYLVESSATDNAARGRASRRLSEFMAAIEHSRKVGRGEV